MKKYIVNIFKFIFIVAVIDFTVGKIGDYLQTHAKGGSTRALNDLVMNDCHDVIILGSSRARHHYDTPFLSDTLELDVYNAGYDGNGVVLAYGLLEMILERYHPKLILFDVEPAFDINVYNNDNRHKRYISSLKPYYRYHFVGEIIKDVSIDEWYKVHFGLLRYNSKLFSLIFDKIFYRPMQQKGYKPLNGIYTRDPDESNGQSEEIDPFKLKYVDKLLLLAKTHEVPLAVIASPKYGAKSSKGLTPVIDLCYKYNFPFIDYYSNELFMQHKDWFKEPMHLNHEGARIFSKNIASEIKNLIVNRNYVQLR